MGVCQITIQPQGQVLRVDLAAPGSGTEDFHRNASLSSAVTFPLTIGSDTTLYTANDGNYTLSVKQLDGTELRGDVVRLGMDVPLVVAPLPSAAQVAADSANLLALAPTGAVAETYPRMTGTGSSQTAPTSGRLHLSAVYLPAGVTVSSITYLSGGTPGSGLTNQWFALYSSALALLAQTADDTTTAWGSTTTKTLTIASPVTTTYSGLHYVGIMVAASTVPTLLGFTSSTHGIAPITNGSSTTGLTTTAPSTAAALTAQTTTPYAYLS